MTARHAAKAPAKSPAPARRSEGQPSYRFTDWAMI